MNEKIRRERFTKKSNKKTFENVAKTNVARAFTSDTILCIYTNMIHCTEPEHERAQAHTLPGRSFSHNPVSVIIRGCQWPATS